MKCFLLAFFSWLLLGQFCPAQIKSGIGEDLGKLTNTHDILLSPWGPYSKRYAGISHVADIHSGLRFDFSVLPSIYGSKLLVPNVLMHSEYYPWKTNNDLTKYTYRYELEWKDRTYTDVTYHVIDSATTLVAIHFVNNTDLPQDMGADLMTYIDYPENYASCAVKSSKDILWKNAVTYSSLVFAHPRPTDNLVNNGWLRGEVRDSMYMDGRAIASHFGRNKGDKVTYQIQLPNNLKKGKLAIRYKMKAGNQGVFRLSGMINQKITLSGTGNIAWKVIPYTVSATNSKTVTLESEGNEEIALNGLLFMDPSREPESCITAQNQQWKPKQTANIASRSTILKYPDINTYYGLAVDQTTFKLKEIKNDELDVFFKKLVNDHVNTTFTGNGKGDYTDVCIGPLSLEAHDTKTIYALLCTGSYSRVKNRLASLNILKQQALASPPSPSWKEKVLPEGWQYRLGWQLLKATLMTNIVYPIYTQNDYIRHFTPGKWWNSIYTWDVGFIALGLNEINHDLAADCINAYTTAVGSQSAFILHGTPIPTQIYAFYDLWNKTQSTKLLSYFYPRLRQYYEFLAGKSGSSTIRKFKSNILCTWDYFYNSGGWDDYPPQVAVHEQKAENKVAPVITTAQYIRIAKMMRMAATYLHKEKDIKMYDEDITSFSNALQKYSWNSKSGYFSYVVHNKEGEPVGHFKFSEGIDYNMGLGGVYPLLSGICTPDQQKGLLDKIFSPQHLWTTAGISVVDQSAPYYKPDGYWNGTVWMPHQWFMWKTMLDLGRADLALKIARKALDVYKAETNASYKTFEHFSAKTGRGGGWHQFSGLSSPVLNWFASYYRIGTVTAGFEIWINKQAFNKDSSSYTANISFDKTTAAHPRSIVVCMKPYHSYTVTFNGKQIAAESPYDGLVEITFPTTNEGGDFTIKPSS